MSNDVLSTLKGLSDSVRSRIEATADYKALMVMQRAIGEVEELFRPAAAGAAVAPTELTAAEADGGAADAASVEELASEAVDDIQRSGDSNADAEPAFAASEEATSQSADALAETDTSAVSAASDEGAVEAVSETDAIEVEAASGAEEPAVEEAMVAETAASLEPAGENPSSDVGPEPVEAGEAAEIPVEAQEIVAELAAAAETGALPASEANP